MKLKTLLLSSLLYFSLALAIAQAKQVTIQNLLAVELADWDGDASRDRAVLARPENPDEEGAVLYIYLSNNEKLIEKKNIAWVGLMWGTIPTLSVNKSGSLLVHSMNESIGRNRWSQKLTLSYRKNRFIVSGYSYSSRDTLKIDEGVSVCDVNLLTGKGVLNGKPFRIAKQKRSLKDWNDDFIPKKCMD